jgi:hypothetical protein
MEEAGTTSTNSTRVRARKFTPEQIERIISLYDSCENKTTALGIINAIDGFQKVDRAMIFRFKKKPKVKSESLGRPVSQEFEREILAECAKIFDMMKNEQREEFKADPYAAYSYAVIKECARYVMEREYWDEEKQDMVEKWKIHPLTKNLQFSNMWVCGMLKRNKVERRHNSSGASGSNGSSGSTNILEEVRKDNVLYDSEDYSGESNDGNEFESVSESGNSNWKKGDSAAYPTNVDQPASDSFYLPDTLTNEKEFLVDSSSSSSCSSNNNNRGRVLQEVAAPVRVPLSLPLLSACCTHETRATTVAVTAAAVATATDQVPASSDFLVPAEELAIASDASRIPGLASVKLSADTNSPTKLSDILP